MIFLDNHDTYFQFLPYYYCEKQAMERTRSQTKGLDIVPLQSRIHFITAGKSQK